MSTSRVRSTHIDEMKYDVPDGNRDKDDHKSQERVMKSAGKVRPTAAATSSSNGSLQSLARIFVPPLMLCALIVHYCAFLCLSVLP